MAWSGLANNQAVSDTNLYDAVANGVFTLGSTPFPALDNKEVTKARCSGYINVPNPYYPAYAGKLDDQLVVKGDLPPAGDFILDPYVGLYNIDSVSCTGIPSFSYPITSGNTTLPYSGVIPSQYITVSISLVSGQDPADAVSVSLYVNSVLLDTQYVSVYGGTTSLHLPSAVYPPSSIRISVGTGTAPTPTPFSSLSFGAAAVSRNTGQYQLAASGVNESKYYTVGSPTVTPGSVYVSSNYGATWTLKTSLPITYWNKVAISGNGQFCLAVFYGGAYKSSDYGVTWTQITNFPPHTHYSGTYSKQDQNFTCAALSGTGQYQVITTAPTTFAITSGFVRSFAFVYVSSDYGATWTESRQGHVNCATISSDGQTIFIGAWQDSAAGSIYKSSNAGSSWTFMRYTDVITDISVTSDGLYVIAAQYVSSYYMAGMQYLLFSADGGTSWNSMTSGNSYSHRWWGVSAFKNGGYNYAAAVSMDLPSSSSYVIDVSTTYASNDTSSGSRRYRCISTSADGTYQLAGYTNGLIRSTDGGLNWSVL